MNPIKGSCGTCTVWTEDGKVFDLRTMEFPEPMSSELKIFPKEKSYLSTNPWKTEGLKWISKYGYVGINGLHIQGIDEGMNSEGLSFSFLTLNCSKYQTVSEEQKNQALAITDIGDWILGNFSTVDEVIEALKDVRVWEGDIDILGSIPGLHISLKDAKEACVIEFINGGAEIHRDTFGVLTNDPKFEWHLQHLQEYNNLSSNNPPETTILNMKIPTNGIGTGMKGLPGDWSSPSRFVRISKTMEFAVKPKDAIEATIDSTHILNSVDIPKGVMRLQVKDKTYYETTRYRTIKNLTDKIFMWNCYNDQTLRQLDLKRLTFDPKVSYPSWKVETEKPTIINMNNHFEK